MQLTHSFVSLLAGMPISSNVAGPCFFGGPADGLGVEGPSECAEAGAGDPTECAECADRGVGGPAECADNGA